MSKKILTYVCLFGCLSWREQTIGALPLFLSLSLFDEGHKAETWCACIVIGGIPSQVYFLIEHKEWLVPVSHST